MRSPYSDDEDLSLAKLLSLPTATDRFFMLVSSLVMTILVWTSLQGSADPSRYFIVYVLLYVLCYYPGTAIALRNIPLGGSSRYIFCFTAIPVFAFFLLVSAYLAFAEIPGFASTWAQVTGSGSSRRGMLHGAVVGAIATVLFYGFYRFLKLLDNQDRSGR